MKVNRDSARLDDEDLLVAFANTSHAGDDDLENIDGLRSWAASVGLTADGANRAAEDLPLVHAIRESVRALLLAQNGVAIRPDLTPLESVLLRFSLTDRIGVRAADPSTTTAVVAAAVAAAVLAASARTGWSRLKACPGPDCAWAFRDQTRNGSRRWCQMSECGNRAKGAAFRARAGRQR